MKNKYFKEDKDDTLVGFSIFISEDPKEWLTQFCEENCYEYKDVAMIVNNLAKIAEEAALALDIPVGKVVHIIKVVGFSTYLKHVMNSILSKRTNGGK